MSALRSQIGPSWLYIISAYKLIGDSKCDKLTHRHSDSTAALASSDPTRRFINLEAVSMIAKQNTATATTTG